MIIRMRSVFTAGALTKRGTWPYDMIGEPLLFILYYVLFSSCVVYTLCTMC